MRFILILAMLGTLLILPGVSFADANADCQSDCASDKATRDVSCPPPGEDTDLDRSQCLQDSQDTYNSCIDGCPPPEPVEPPNEN